MKKKIREHKSGWAISDGVLSTNHKSFTFNVIGRPKIYQSVVRRLKIIIIIIIIIIIFIYIACIKTNKVIPSMLYTLSRGNPLVKYISIIKKYKLSYILKVVI